MTGGYYTSLHSGKVKKLVMYAPACALIKDSTHFVLFEKPRFEFFNEIQSFLKE